MGVYFAVTFRIAVMEDLDLNTTRTEILMNAVVKRKTVESQTKKALPKAVGNTVRTLYNQDIVRDIDFVF